MKNTDNQEIKKTLTELFTGTDVHINLSPETSVKIIKQRLAAGNFSCNLWTIGWTDEKIENADELLTKENVIHCWDELMDSFICFNSERDMKDFYTRLRIETPINKLKEIAESGCNTPLINFFKD